MKLSLKRFIVFFAFSFLFIAQNIFATNFSYTQNDSKITLEQYTTLSEQMKSQINTLSKEINDYKKYIESEKNKFATLEESYNKTKVLPIKEENYKKAKDLKKSIIIKTNKEETISDNDTISQLTKNGQYEKALNKLQSILNLKKQQHKEYSNAMSTWIEIDRLISY